MVRVISILISLCSLLSLLFAAEKDPEKVEKAKERFLVRPQWQLGIGLTYLRLPYYRGSNQEHHYLWPIPYFKYRTEKIQMENSGASGNIFESDRFLVNASISASLRVNSGKTSARMGMPNLDPLAEVGPMASWEFWRDTYKRNIFSLNTPFRTAWSVDLFRAKYVGTFFVPFVAWTAYPQKLTLGLFSEVTLASMFASQGYHDYYYSVSPSYANPGRPAYRAHGGYSGSHATWYLSKKWPSFTLFGFIRYDQMKGAAFADGPLMERKDSVMFVLGAVLYLWQSQTMVKRAKIVPQEMGN